MNIKEIRKALNVPKEQRICQYIYNVMREEYEKEMHVKIYNGGMDADYWSKGIDIFSVKDEEFIKKLSK